MRIGGIAFVAAFCWCLGPIAPAAQSEPWAERLGFPVGSRVVILEAAEAGLMWETNHAVSESLISGPCASASVIATGPWFNAFANWAKDHPNYDLGLSVALVNPYANPQWKFVSSRQNIPSLIDPEGLPWNLVAPLAANVVAEQAERELDAQMAKAMVAGVKPSHLSGYRGVFFLRSDLTEVLLNASRRYWLPTPVVELTPELVERFQQMGYPLDAEMIRMVGEYPLPKLDDIQFLPLANEEASMREGIDQVLDRLTLGLTLIIASPATASPGLHESDSEALSRVLAARFLTDGTMQTLLEKHKVTVTTWREIMRRFELRINASDKNEN